MRTYQVKQKFRLGGERFDIKDELGNVEYQVEGSFLKIPKTFTIYDKNGQEEMCIRDSLKCIDPHVGQSYVQQ